MINRTRAAGADSYPGAHLGVATAVLALLSAGTLATLGMVTAGELPEPAPERPPARQQAAVQSPGAVRVTQPPAPSHR